MKTVDLKGIRFELILGELPRDLWPSALGRDWGDPETAGAVTLAALERLLGAEGYGRFMALAEEGVITPEDVPQFIYRIMNAYGFFPGESDRPWL